MQGYGIVRRWVGCPRWQAMAAFSALLDTDARSECVHGSLSMIEIRDKVSANTNGWQRENRVEEKNMSNRQRCTSKSRLLPERSPNHYPSRSTSLTKSLTLHHMHRIGTPGLQVPF